MKTIRPSLSQRFHLPALAFFLAALPGAAWASAGQFQFVSGDVRIVAPDGRERPAKKGGEISEGESVVSGSGSTAQLRMTDGGILAIRQESRVRIDEYRFNGQEDGSERSFFSLVKGGFRSITGTVGKLNKENYRIKTPAATIGIRGTDSETIHIANAGELGAQAQPGTYNRVNSGATVVNGTMTLPNQVAYAPNLGTPGILLPQMPSIFQPPSPPQAAKASAQTPVATNTATATADSSSATTAATDTPPPPAAASTVIASDTLVLPPPPEPTTTLVGTSTAVVSASSIYAAPYGYGGVGADISWRTECSAINACYTGWLSGGGSMVLEPNTNRTILLDGSGLPVLIADSDAFGSMQYTSGTASLLDFGQTAVAGTTVRWGRYVGADSFIDDMGTRDPLVMNLMWADQALSYVAAQAALASTGALNFNLVGGAGTVTDDLNNVYHLTNGSLQVLAGGSSMTLHVTTDTVASRSWDLTYQSTADALTQFYQAATTTGPGGLPLVSGSIKVDGAIVPTDVKGQASGVFIGSSATGALTSFSANAAPAAALPAGASLSGTALLAQ